MFAFAIYDARARKLWLVRDRLGIKPLYYRLEANRLTFASEVKGILALTTETPICDLSVLHEWLYYGNPLGGRTLYSGIKQLLPGHYLEVDLSTFRHSVRAYWSLDEQTKVASIGPSDSGSLVARTRSLLEQAVTRQLVSDVPVGLFLSGGVDSSAIAAFASRHYARSLTTYSVAFDFTSGDGELPKARRIAARYGTEHHELHIASGAVGDLVEKMVHHHDMPFSDAANIPLYLMASQIGDQTKVVLQGDGGDELFGGYRRYLTLNYHRFLRPAARMLQSLHRFKPRSSLHYRVLRYLRAFAAEDLGTTVALLLTSEDRALEPGAVFSPQLRHTIEGTDPFARHHECMHRFSDRDISNQMSFLDLLITLPDTYLEKVDRATMAASVEVRVPFLDHDLVDFVVSLPGNVKTPWGRQKGLLKAALRGVVPDEVLDGPKTGLDVPYGNWLHGALRPLFFDHLSTFSQQNPDVLDVACVHRLFERTESGQQDRSFMLWKLLNLMIWTNSSRVAILGER
jgi:asparagine synthase (glutamine-hydrolysing)